MINIQGLKPGDTVITKYGGKEKKGKILQVDHEDKKVLVATNDDNEFWYDLDNLYPIYLSETTLLELNFTKDMGASSNGQGILYIRGPFSIRLFEAGHKPLLTLHYRDETRNLFEPITLNELQNHYYGMTNFYLE